MILSTLAESGRVEHLHPAFKLVLDYVKSHDLTKVPAGRIALDGDRVFINVDDATLRTEAEQALEVHRRYIDIHFPLSGSERVGWSPLEALAAESSREPFDVARDLPFTTCRQPLTLMWCLGSSTSCIPKMPMPLLLAAVHCANLWQR